MFFDISIPSDIRLYNIECLHIRLPINDQFWSIIPSLKQLKTLLIFSNAEIYQSQVERLFDRISYLELLHISQSSSLPLQILLFNYINLSVRRFDFYSSFHLFDTD